MSSTHVVLDRDNATDENFRASLAKWRQERQEISDRQLKIFKEQIHADGEEFREYVRQILSTATRKV